jgi:hypothetical protein
MWFYELAHQPLGPVDIDVIQSLLASGQITGATLVWREGMPDWKPLQQTELAQIGQKVFPDLSPVTAQPPVPYVQPVHQVRSGSLKNLFIWWLVLEMFSIFFYVFSQLLTQGSLKTALICIFEMPLIAAAVIQFVLIFQLWQIVQDGFARTSPGKAVGFLFIPLFRIYWQFVAYFGLAKDLNRYIRQHHENDLTLQQKKTHPFISLLFAIFSFVGMGFSYYELIITFSALIKYRMNSAAYMNAAQAFTLPLLIIAVTNMILTICMFVDLYRAASSILKTEETH